MFSEGIGVLFRRSKEILQREGLLPLIKRAFLFSVRSLVGFFFSYGNYYIYEKTLNGMTESEFTPKIQNPTLKILYTPMEVDELIAEGFDFSSYSNIENLKERLGKGAILFCVFIGRYLAHTSWVAMSEESKRDIDILPFAVNFQSEVCIGSAVTYPKYRRAGIYTYVYSEIYRFLKEKGWCKAKFSVKIDNIAPQKAQAKLGSGIIAEGRYLKLLWWKSWKEKTMGEAKRRNGK